MRAARQGKEGSGRAVDRDTSQFGKIYGVVNQNLYVVTLWRRSFFGWHPST
jgi:hypothetical protein